MNTTSTLKLRFQIETKMVLETKDKGEHFVHIGHVHTAT